MTEDTAAGGSPKETLGITGVPTTACSVLPWRLGFQWGARRQDGEDLACRGPCWLEDFHEGVGERDCRSGPTHKFSADQCFSLYAILGTGMQQAMCGTALLVALCPLSLGTTVWGRS